MKRKKLRRLVEDVLAARDAVPERPITFDTLSIDFEARTVALRGRTITVDNPGIDIPMLSSDRLIITNSGTLV
jgi:hypothetical protein